MRKFRVHLWALAALALSLLCVSVPRRHLPEAPARGGNSARAASHRKTHVGGLLRPRRAPDAALAARKLAAAQDESPKAREYRSELLVYVKPGTQAEALGRDYGFALRRTLVGDPSGVVYFAGSPQAAGAARPRVAADPRVRAAFQNGPARMVRHVFVPNDPYYPPPGSPTSNFAGQWHLDNGTFKSSWTVGILPAWGHDLVGKGVAIGIVDDGLETAHPDLAPNFDAADSYDFGNNSPDPNPVNTDDDHGTATSGLAAARGGNRLGVTGVAPFASLSCTRVDFNNPSITQFVNATTFHALSPGDPVMVKNHSYGDSANYVDDSAQLNGLNQSTTSGFIHCFSAGNWRGGGTGMDDCVKQGLAASPDAITVAAMGEGGTFAVYSCFGSCIFVCAPSWDGIDPLSGFHPAIFTTDRTGTAGYNTSDSTDPNNHFTDFPDNNYTNTFDGTSAAAPQVTGAMALARQLQPNLSTRLAKHLLVMSSLQIDPTDGSIEGGGDGTSGSAWITNAAGHKFNQNYGFGLIQMDALAQLAVQYNGVSSLQTESLGPVSTNIQLVDGDATGKSVTFTLNGVSPKQPLEELQVTLDISCGVIPPAGPGASSSPGDIEVTLTSPHGTKCRLVGHDANDIELGPFDLAWTYTTNAFWGEDPAGTWTLTVADAIANGNVNTLNSYAVNTFMGSPTPAPFVGVLSGPATSAASPISYTLFLSQAASSAPLSSSIQVSSNATVTSVTADPNAKVAGTVWDIQVTPKGGVTAGTITCQVGANAVTSVVGMAHNPATNTVSTLFDSTIPGCVVTAPAATNQAPIPFTLTFSEPVTEPTASGISITAGTLVSISGSGAVYSAQINPSPAGHQGPVSCQVLAGASTNAVGTQNAVSNTASSDYDTIPPKTTITFGPPPQSFVGSATFNFTSDESGSTWNISLDGGPAVSNGTGSYTFNNLTSGTHTVSIAAVDPAGNVDPRPATYTWTIPIILADGTAPLLNPFDNPFMVRDYTFAASATPQWAVDATPPSVLGAAPYFTGPASLNYNNGSDDSSGATANNGTATSNAIGLGSLTTARLKFMCNFGLAGSETRTVNILASNLSAVQKSYALSTTVDPGLGLCAPAGVWHEHVVDVTSYGPTLGVQFAFNTISSVAAGSPGWFVDDLEISDLLVSALAQYATGSSVPLPVGSATTSTSIDFRGIVSNAAGTINPVELDIEVKPLGTAFNGSVTAKATATGTGGTPPVTVGVTVPLPPGQYHWRARTVSPPSTGTPSNWMEFGLNATNDIDFSIASPPPPGGGGGGGGCGVTGFEALLIAAGLRLLRRRRRSA